MDIEMDGKKEKQDGVAYLNMIALESQNSSGGASRGGSLRDGLALNASIRKIVFILIGIFVSVIVIFLIILIVDTINTTKREVAYGYVDELEKSYMETLSFYRTYVGFGIDTDEYAMTPFNQTELNKIGDSSKKAREALGAYDANVKNNISSLNKEQKKTLDRSAERAGVILNRIDYNIDLLGKFYVAFSEPVYNAIRTGNNTNCTPNATAQGLLSNENDSIKAAAQEYDTLLCEVIRSGAETVFVTDIHGVKVLNAQRLMLSNLKEIKDSDTVANELAEIRHALAK